MAEYEVNEKVAPMGRPWIDWGGAQRMVAFCFVVQVIARDSLGSHYESKVLEIDDSKDKIKYLVHYDGWNSRWDEWITGERMMKLTEENKVWSRMG